MLSRLPCLQKSVVILSSSAARSTCPASTARPRWRGRCWTTWRIRVVRSAWGIRIVGTARRTLWRRFPIIGIFGLPRCIGFVGIIGPRRIRHAGFVRRIVGAIGIVRIWVAGLLRTLYDRCTQIRCSHAHRHGECSREYQCYWPSDSSKTHCYLP
jgi:hypothetical protein